MPEHTDRRSGADSPPNSAAIPGGREPIPPITRLTGSISEDDIRFRVELAARITHAFFLDAVARGSPVVAPLITEAYEDLLEIATMDRRIAMMKEAGRLAASVAVEIHEDRKNALLHQLRAKDSTVLLSELYRLGEAVQQRRNQASPPDGSPPASDGI